MSALFKGEVVEEIIHLELVSAMNELLKVEFTSFRDYNQRFSIRIHKGFGIVTSELNQMFKSE